MNTFDQELVDIMPWMRVRASYHAKNKFEADDLVQNTILKCLENRDKFSDKKGELKAWASIIMRNYYIQSKRKLSSKNTSETSAEYFPVKNNYKPDDILNKKEIENKMAQLDSRKIEAFVLKMAGFSITEISKELKVKENNVKIKIFRAKKHVREALEPYR